MCEGTRTITSSPIVVSREFVAEWLAAHSEAWTTSQALHLIRDWALECGKVMMYLSVPREWHWAIGVELGAAISVGHAGDIYLVEFHDGFLTAGKTLLAPTL